MPSSTTEPLSAPPDDLVTPLIALRGITKRFPGVLALDGVSFDIHHGEVLGLVGENGAGKSTIIKVLSGVYTPDEGQIFMRQEPVVVRNPYEAQTLGITTIYQETTLVPELNAIENIFLGRELKMGALGSLGGLLNKRAMKERAAALYSDFEPDVSDLYRPVGELGALRQKVVEVVKGLAFVAHLVIMDEPTAPLTDRERDVLFNHIRSLKRRGVAVLLVTHRLQELFGLADRAVVMRDGRHVGTVDPEQVGSQGLIRLMVGRDVKSVADLAASRTSESKPDTEPEEVLRITGLSRRGVLDDISLKLYKREVLGIGGLAGSGRTELARAIVGADKIDAGTVTVDGTIVRLHSPHDAIKRGIALVPEERKVDGIFAEFSVARNISVASLRRLLRARVVIDERREVSAAKDYVSRLKIRTPGVRQEMRFLSGGNQQKAIFARYLFAQSRILILDEPTQGIDIAAKEDVYGLVDEYITSGGAVIVISSELSELIGISDRILVLSRGRVAGEVAGQRRGSRSDDVGPELDQQILELAIKGAES